MPATISDVARLAGVSRMTVSRVYSASGSVAKSTRDRVLAAGQGLQYQPNLLARGLSQNSIAAVGVVVLELDNPYFGPIVSGIEAICRKRDTLVIVGKSGREASAEKQHVQQFRQFRTSGMIVSPVNRSVRHLIDARESGVHVVLLERQWSVGDCVTVDDTRGGQLVAEHLLSRGHRRIGLVCHQDADHGPHAARVAAFESALASARRKVDPSFNFRLPALASSASSLEQGVRIADRMLELAKRPTAIFAGSDLIGMGIVERLIERGVSVPDDLAVIGYDDIKYAGYSRVPLTTVAVPKQLMGELAAKLLFDRADSADQEEHQHIRLAPELIIRSSCP